MTPAPDRPRALPRVELHLHLDCSLSYEAARRLDLRTTREAYASGFVAPVKCRDVMDLLRRVDLEVCPTSDVQSGVCPAYGDHPIDALGRAGVGLGVNTDGRTLCGVSLADEHTRRRGSSPARRGASWRGAWASPRGRPSW